MAPLNSGLARETVHGGGHDDGDGNRGRGSGTRTGNGPVGRPQNLNT